MKSPSRTRLLALAAVFCLLIPMVPSKAHATNGSSFVTRYRTAVTTALNALEALRVLGDEYTARSWGTTLVDQVSGNCAGDFNAPNCDIIRADLVSAVVTTNLMVGSSCLASAGAQTNWEKVRQP